MLRFNLRPAAILWALAITASLMATAPTSAQQVLVEKDLCGLAVDPSGSGLCIISGPGGATPNPIVTPQLLADYQVTLTNSGATVPVDLADILPVGWNWVPPAQASCTDANGNSSIVPLSNPSAPPGTTSYFGPLILLPGVTTCHFYGYFVYSSNTSNDAINEVTVFPAGDHHDGHQVALSNPVNAEVQSPSMIPADVAVLKEAINVVSAPGSTTVRYRITVTNNGATDLYGLQLQDRLALLATSVPLTATYLGNATCTVSGTSNCMVPGNAASPAFVPSPSPVDFVEWHYVPAGGVLRAGDTMVIEFDVRIDVPSDVICQLDPAANQLINSAHIGFNVPGATTTLFEFNPTDNTSSVPVWVDYGGTIDPNCVPPAPALTISKKLDTSIPASGAFPWSSTLDYTITLHNTSTTNPIAGISLFDQINGILGDLVAGGVGTPTFKAQVVYVTCASCTPTTPPPAYLQQTVPGYLQPHWMVGTDVTVTLAPDDGAPGGPDELAFQIGIAFSEVACDSYPDVQQKPVINIVRAKYDDPGLGGAAIIIQDSVTALFEAPAPCLLKVTKKLASGDPLKITFGQPVHYTVTYQNLDAQPVSVGTMIDALRIVQSDYASPLNVHYSYVCTESGGVTGFPFGTTQSGTVQVVHTGLPQQGVRILQNYQTGPVLFPGNSTVTCEITLTVDAPAAGASNCARVGLLENAAIMDLSEYYDPNLPWGGTTPGFYDTVSLPLPACFDLVLNKAAGTQPGPSGANWTTPNGGPFFYDVKLFNSGDPIVPTDNIQVSDNFTTPNPVNLASSATEDCSNGGPLMPAPVSPDCDLIWAPPPTTANPSGYDVKTLSSNWTAHGLFTLPGPYPNPPSEICNDAEATVDGVKPSDPYATHPDWYARFPATWKTHRCVGIFRAADLKVVKTVEVMGPATSAPATTFSVQLNCTYVFNGTNYGQNPLIALNYPPSSIQYVTQVPDGSTCHISEIPPPAGPIAEKSCPSGFGQWTTIQYPNAVGPDGTTQSALAHGGTTLEVHNIFECLKEPPPPNGPFYVLKLVVNHTQADLSGWLYPITVICNGQTTPLDLPANAPQLVGNYAPTTQCQVDEDPLDLGLPDANKACPDGGTPQWQTPVYNPVQPVIVGQQPVVTITNQLDCVKTKPASVTKKVVNNTHLPNGALANWSFAVHVICDDGTDTTYNLGDGQSVQVTAGGPVTHCWVKEDLQQVAVPQSGDACPPGMVLQWSSYIAGSDYLLPGSETIVVNVLDCVKVNLGTVTKKVVNHTTADLSLWQFALHVICEDGTETTFHLADGQSGQVSIGDPNTTCKVDEDLTQIVLPPAEKACPPGMIPQWSSYQVGPDYLLPGGEVTIVNVLDCVGEPAPLGTLTVWKYVSNQTLYPLAGMLFTISVDCGGTVTILSLQNGGSDTVHNIADGTTCTVTETLPLPVPPSGVNECFVATWVPQWLMPIGYFPQQSVLISGQSATLYVLNTLQCVPGANNGSELGSLTVTKTLGPWPPWMPPLPDGAIFPVQVTCTPGPTPVLGLTTPGALQETIANLAMGSDCSVLELPSPNYATPPVVCEWQTTYPLGTNVTIGGNNQLEVLNTLDCGDPMPGAQVTVEKIVIVDGGQTDLGLSFDVNTTCTQNGVTTVDSVALDPANGYQFTSYLAQGNHCVVEETPAPAIPAAYADQNCNWQTSYTTSQNGSPPVPGDTVDLTLPYGQQFVIEITNELICQEPPPPTSGLSVTKTCSQAVAVPPPGSGVEANCQITVALTGSTVPATITILDALLAPINVPGSENQIVSMTSTENWTCPAMPVVAGVGAPCQVPGADIANAGGQSIIDMVVQFHDAGNATEAQNCVVATGLDANGVAIVLAPQVCAQFDGPGLPVCDPGSVRVGKTCVAPRPSPKLPDFTVSVMQPEPCTPGKNCTFVIDLANETGDVSPGPLFLSADLPGGLGKNGRSVGNWFCATSDMGSLCHTAPKKASGQKLMLKLPLMLPKRVGNNSEACFAIAMPAAGDARAIARAVQLGLAAKGYELGTIDGVIGPKSRTAIAQFAKRSGATLDNDSMDEVYALMFGQAPLPGNGSVSGKPTCVPIKLVPVAKPVTPVEAPKLDQRPDLPSEDEPRDLACDPPHVLNRRGACVCPPETVSVGDQCLAPDVPLEFPDLTLPEGFGLTLQ